MPNKHATTPSSVELRNQQWGVEKSEILRHVSTVIASMERGILQLFTLQLGVFYFAASSVSENRSIAPIMLLIQGFLIIAYHFMHANLIGHYIWLDIHLIKFKSGVVKEIGYIYPVFHLIAFLTPTAIWIILILLLCSQGRLPSWMYLPALLPLLLAVCLVRPFKNFMICMIKALNSSHPTFSEQVENTREGEEQR